MLFDLWNFSSWFRFSCRSWLFAWLLFAIISFTHTNVTWILFYYIIHTKWIVASYIITVYLYWFLHSVVRCHPSSPIERSSRLGAAFVFTHSFTSWRLWLPQTCYFPSPCRWCSMSRFTCSFVDRSVVEFSFLASCLWNWTITSRWTHVQSSRFAHTCSSLSNCRPCWPSQDSSSIGYLYSTSYATYYQQLCSCL